MHTLNSYLIPAPISTLLTIILGLSIAVVSDYTGKKIVKDHTPVFEAMYFFAGLLALSWLTWIICLVSLATTYIFQGLLILVVSFAAFLVLTKRAKLASALNFPLTHTETKERYLIYLLTGVFVCYLLLSLSVPTDADSLSYHLALPVEIFKNKSLYFNPDHIHFRMAGFGEMLNLLGVATGCPQLGSFIQIIAVLFALRAWTGSISRQSGLNLITLFLGMPVLLFLIPNQKHQLTGILCTSVCFLYLSETKRFTSQKLVLFFSLALFAAGIKYSFLLSFASLFLFFILKKPADVTYLHFLTKITLLTAIILGPQLFFKWYYLGDPLSPLLEQFTSKPDPVMIKLYQYIKGYSDSPYSFPINLVFTKAVGKISTVVGIAAAGIILLPMLFRRFKLEVISIALLVLLILTGGQASSRFLLEPVLWMMPVAITAFQDTRYYKYFMIAVRVQLFALLPVLIVGVYILIPSLFTNSARESVMLKASVGYAESKWINEVLPPDAKICIAGRSRAYLPRTYFPWEYLYFTSMEKPDEAEALDRKLKDYKVGYIILSSNGLEALKNRYAGKIVAGPKKFHLATRNPFNSVDYEMVIYKLK